MTRAAMVAGVATELPNSVIEADVAQGIGAVLRALRDPSRLGRQK